MKFIVGKKYILNYPDAAFDGEIFTILENHTDYLRILVNFKSYYIPKKSDIAEHLEEIQRSITITEYGKTTVAVFRDGTGEHKKFSHSKCNKKDPFIFEIGAKLALERIFEDEQEKEFEPPCIARLLHEFNKPIKEKKNF